MSIIYVTSAQQLKNIAKIGNLSEGLIAIKNDDSWGFIDIKGVLVINFRKDIATSSGEFPVFSNGLCLIKEIREDIIYYGFINTKGETIIPAEYIVATPFKNGFSRVINYYKTDTGTNAFGQSVVYYTYNELIIDTENKSVLNFSGSHNLLLHKLKLQKDIPTIRSKFINDDLISIKEDNNTFSIYNLNK
ncbi:WG repeat-containing protein [Polaribacter sp. ALD11]|uniref:WG repeat-containing protein n=1 Tax=Polaribacter sp. ALD11 TaxID=2058137 RepID=UPI0012FD42CD|nr:WG repeat-containing protein [Polaribacter sp. ALD11]